MNKELAKLVEELRQFTVPELCDGCAEYHTTIQKMKETGLVIPRVIWPEKKKRSNIMREYTDTFCPIDHVSIDVESIPEAVDFFENVLGMTVYRVQGDAKDPSSVWLDGGIQLIKMANALQENGRFHHLAFQVADVDTILLKAEPYGAMSVPGKGHHWFMLPNGIKFELKQQK